MTWVERQWQRVSFATPLLLPVSLLFRAAVALRRAAYAVGILKTHRLPVPVVVVGNITVGGTGKTPLVLWLTRFLVSRGMRPGIVSRGYRASTREPSAVSVGSDPSHAGDEPVLLAQRSDCPVWIGANRVAAAQALLRSHAECDVIVSDDGLQHYALARDAEIAVIDGARAFGNGFMLPAGPLREPRSRLSAVDAVVVNGAGDPAVPHAKLTRMHLAGRAFRNVLNPQHVVGPEHFHRLRVHAIAGIGHPARFFDHLRALGLEFQAHAFADHHAFRASDLAFEGADAVLMTEKDAVKCAAFASERHWVLPVDAITDPELGELILRKIRHRRRP